MIGVGVQRQQAWLAVRFFWLWGIAFGTLLGFVTGSLIFPILGTIFSTIWGIMMGFCLGLMSGVMVAIATLIAPVSLETAKVYRRRLSIALGIVVSLGAVYFLHITSVGTLWENPYMYGDSDYSTFTPYYWPSMVSALFWGGLSAAYVAHRFVELCAREAQDQSHPEYRPVVLDFPDDIVAYWVGRFFGRGSIYPVIVVAGSLISLNLQPGATSERVFRLFLNGAIFGLVYALIAALLVGLANGLMLTFLNRIILHEYFYDLTQQHYQRIVSRLSGLFTLAMGVMVAFGLLAPQPGRLLHSSPALRALGIAFLAATFTALMASMVARDFARWYFESREWGMRWTRERINGFSTSAISKRDTRAKIVHRYVDPDRDVSQRSSENAAEHEEINSQDGLTA